MNHALVSVIIPAYNAAPYISHTLASVLSQTHENIEILVVDDGSTDKTKDIVSSFAQKDSRVILLKQNNSGVAAARNLAVANSKGEFIAPLDADDVWHKTNIEKQLRCILQKDASVGVVYAWSLDIDETGFPTGGFRASNIQGYVFETLLSHNFVGNASASLIRRTCLEKAGGYSRRYREENAQGCEDWDLYLRLAECYQFAVVPSFLIGYRRTASNMSNNHASMLRSHLLMLDSVRSRHRDIPEMFYRLSMASFYMHFAHQSLRSDMNKSSAYWLRFALQTDLSTYLLCLSLSKLTKVYSSFKPHAGDFKSKYGNQTDCGSELAGMLELYSEKFPANVKIRIAMGNILHSLSRMAVGDETKR